MIKIETERLVLREYGPGDEPHVLRFLDQNRERLKPVLSEWVYLISNMEDARLFIKRMKSGILLKNLYGLGMWLKSEDRLIGEIVFFNVDWAARQMEIGSFIDADYQGMGLVTEAKAGCLNDFFARFNLSKVIAICNIDNISSQRVNEKCGFRRLPSDHPRDVHFYINRDLLGLNGEVHPIDK